MSFSRRRFIIGSIALSLWTFVGRLTGKPAVLDQGQLEQTLHAWMEALLPTDSISPGAGELGVHLEVIEKITQNRQYLKLLEISVGWANVEAQKLASKQFHELSSEQAEQIVALAESKGLSSMPGLFFYHTLRDGKQFYYAHRESWVGVGFPHPPQPLGYMDYTEAPKP